MERECLRVLTRDDTCIRYVVQRTSLKREYLLSDMQNTQFRHKHSQLAKLLYCTCANQKTKRSDVLRHRSTARNILQNLSASHSPEPISRENQNTVGLTLRYVAVFRGENLT